MNWEKGLLAFGMKPILFVSWTYWRMKKIFRRKDRNDLGNPLESMLIDPPFFIFIV